MQLPNCLEVKLGITVQVRNILASLVNKAGSAGELLVVEGVVPSADDLVRRVLWDEQPMVFSDSLQPANEGNVNCTQLIISDPIRLRRRMEIEQLGNGCPARLLSAIFLVHEIKIVG